MENLNIASINVRGLNNEIKRSRLFTWLKDKKIDIACLQETFCVENFKNEFKKGYDGLVYHGYTDSSHSRGVCIMIDKRVNCKVINVHKTDDGRRIMVNMSIDETDISLISLYAPNNMNDRSVFFKKTNNWIDKHALYKNSLLIAGDMNCCL